MNKVLKYIILSLVIVPLIVDRSVFFPFITGKSVFLRGIITLAFLLIVIGIFVNREFSKILAKKLSLILKNKIFWSIIVFAIIVVIGAFFSSPNFHAMFGDIERAEGMVGLLYYFSIGVLMMLFFEEEDWHWFMKLSLIVSAILFINALSEHFKGIGRPSSFLGNPIYLAVIFLYAIFASFWIIIKENISKIWRIFALVMLPVSVFGIFITKTRGVIAGIFVAFVIMAIYLFFKKDTVLFGGWSANVIAVVILITIILVVGFFVATKNNSFWQKIPGFDRLSKFTLHDTTLITRLISLKISWKAIHLSNEGVKKFLIGWGAENFNVAYNKYYNPIFYRYERSWFDRAHNKLMDVMVMHGLFGLLTYLTLWVFIWKESFRKRKNMYESLALIFFSVAYFVQNLFVFDAIATYVFFFAFVGFVGWLEMNGGREMIKAHRNEESHLDLKRKESGEVNLAWVIGIGVLAVWFLLSFVWFTMVPYYQMRGYLALIKSGSIQRVLGGIDGVLNPYTIAQENIRENLLLVAKQNFKVNMTKPLQELQDKAIDAMNGLIEHEPYEPRYFIQLAQFYVFIGDKINSTKPGYGNIWHNKAISLLNKALKLSPKRLEINYMLAYEYAKLGDKNKAENIFNKLVNFDKENGDTYYYYGMMETSFVNGDYAKAYDLFAKANASKYIKKSLKDQYAKLAYETMLQHFIETKDKKRLLGVAKKLLNINGTDKTKLQEIIKYASVEDWDKINIK